MNVVVLIDGREAIPVRAIPLLTNWASMSPDIVARVLAADEDVFGFEGLQAYHLEAGLPRQILPVWWKKSCVRELKALSERLESTHAGHETQHAQWRDESLLLLPAGAFVWKDEYTTLHDSNWASRLREKRHTAWLLNKCADRNEEIDDAEEPSFMQKIAIRRVDEEFEAWRTLDFSPFIPSINRQNSVMEGFAPVGGESPALAPATAPQPTQRRTWKVVAGPYITETIRAGQYATAKQLFNALESRAGSSGSPFEKGTGDNRGTLFVHEIAQPLTLKTVQNNWKTLLAAANK
ncbi:hypothetical protein [Simplicispira psychrophila]|uniref:hypothetical protein n=1 Tax=Simplicispira psychrophila TaxID=80882 RepID=UPI0012EB4A49|nr:hypothetical protein [Simplicispira psychrophila]